MTKRMILMLLAVILVLAAFLAGNFTNGMKA